MANQRVHILHETITDLRPGGKQSDEVYGYFRSFAAANRYMTCLVEELKTGGYIQHGTDGWSLTGTAASQHVAYRIESIDYLGEYK